MPIHPLPVLSEEQELEAIENLKPPKTVVVRYGFMKSIGEFPYDGDQVIGCGTRLVVRTSRGVELAEMLTTTCTNSGCGSSVPRSKMLEYIEASGGKQYPFSTEGKIVRIASGEDMAEQSRIDSEKPRYVKAAKQIIRDLDLPMKLIEVEQLLSRDRIVFYFTSESRIDFRELVRRLAGEFHVRVEMRQVGARDEARLVADYERCGQHCCCKQFLKVLKPVSMRSAKVQKATLDPTKISGRCGRLMCCLRYEDETYESLRKKLPRRNTRMMSEDGPGTVVNTQILTQLVLLEMDQTGKRQAYALEHLQRMEDQSRPAPREDARSGGSGSGGGRGRSRSRNGNEPGNESARSNEPQRPRPGRPLRDDQVENAEGDNAASIDSSAAEPQMSQPDTDASAAPQQDDGGGEKKKRRRRRRRRRGGGNRGEGGASGSDASPGPTPPPES